MRFLADESCDFAVVRTLRKRGHDVVAVAEFQRRSIDHNLMEQAFREARILLTEDKDFGWLAYVAHMDNPGVVLIRYPARARQGIDNDVARLVEDHGPRLAGAFVVLSPGTIRISKGPEIGQE